MSKPEETHKTWEWFKAKLKSKTVLHKTREVPKPDITKVPTKGIDTFTLELDEFSEQIAVKLTDKSSYIIPEQHRLQVWMRDVGVHQVRIREICDALWNFRSLTYTVSSNCLDVH